MKGAMARARGRLGSGERFDRLEHQLEGRKGVTNPGGLAAYIGRKKYGAHRFGELAAHGKPGY